MTQSSESDLFDIVSGAGAKEKEGLVKTGDTL